MSQLLIACLSRSKEISYERLPGMPVGELYAHKKLCAAVCRYDKKTVRFTILDGEAKIGACELNLAQYATFKSVEGGENPSETIAMPFETEAPRSR